MWKILIVSLACLVNQLYRVDAFSIPNLAQQILKSKDKTGPQSIDYDAQIVRAGRVHVEFESAEHDLMGQNLVLNRWNTTCNCLGTPFKGTDAIFNLGGQNIRYSNLVPMGDLYANWAAGQCPAQLSDPGLSPSQQDAAFQSIINQFNQANNDSTELLCIINAFTTQEIDAQGEYQNGGDPAQLYAKRMAWDIWNPSSNWNAAYFLCTREYLWGALCNWDHFGLDAVTAYTVAHRAALAAAKVAMNNTDLFLKAYFLEGFGQHYLSDLFSAGHLRPPRRVLHSNPKSFDPITNQAPGDQCSQFMHDEDCANGLWVRNLRGDSWPTYGDKQLLNDKSLKNRDMAFNAMQAGLNEVFATYMNKTIPAEADYAALQWVPMVSSMDPGANYVPMFQSSLTGSQAILDVRQNLDDRANAGVNSYTIDTGADNDQTWQGFKTTISSAQSNKNMYPRTVNGLAAETNVTQIRQLNATHMIINRYGPIWTKLYQYWPGRTAIRSWNMVSQSIAPVAPSLNVTWTWSASLSKGTYVLGALYGQTEFYLGLENDDELGGKGVRQLWNISRDLGTGCLAMDYTSPLSDGSSNVVGFVRRCDTVFQMWVQSSPTAAPTMAESWTWTTPIPIVADLVLNSPNSPSQFISVGYSQAQNEYVFGVSTFGSGLVKDTSASTVEANNSGPPSAFLVGSLFAVNTTEYIVRVIPTFSTIRVDTIAIQPSLNVSFITDNLNFDSTQYITLRWSLMDFNGDGNLDLMAFGTRSDGTLVTAIFQSQGNTMGPVFQNPVITTIPGNNVPLLNAPFMRDVTSNPTQVWNSKTQIPPANRAGLLQFFDNYGILGVRLLSPTTRSLATYSVTGQTPAIAGQISSGLGTWGGVQLGFLFD